MAAPAARSRPRLSPVGGGGTPRDFGRERHLAGSLAICGIFAIFAPGDRSVGIEEARLVGLRDRLAHRGPDDAGSWSDGRERQAWIGHRRLAIMDPDHGVEPIVRGDEADPCVVAFNGELLNHRELRRELETLGERFETTCDAETAAAAVARWGEEAIDRFRGMFAILWYRPRTRRLFLARDAFGVVPLLFARLDDGRIAVSSGMRPLRELLGHDARIDTEVLSAYLASIRITIGDRTLLRGVHAIRPGHLVRLELDRPNPSIQTHRWWAPPPPTGELHGHDADEALAAAIEDSLAAHLQSDVEVCTLLSGGLDSAVLTSLAADRIPDLRSFTAIGGDAAGDPDRDAARRVAEHLGLHSTEVSPGGDDDVMRRWSSMIDSLGVPLGTPNEIAIQALAEGVHRAGIKVAIGGEGADELLGGYEPVLRLISAIARARPSAEAAAATLVESIAWIAPTRQAEILHPDWIASIREPLLLAETTASLSDAGSPGESRTYLRWLQEVNLAGLLGRLNHATMLSSVEARPPFADRRVAETVARIASEDLFVIPDEVSGTAGTKVALRRAFAPRLPEAIVARPKASFPTPFGAWAARMLERPEIRAAASPLLSDPSMLERPDPHAGLTAWPLANLGLWSVAMDLPLHPS